MSVVPPLVSPRKTLSPLFERIFTEIFKRFDKDADGALSEAELDDFAVFTNGEPVRP